MSAGQYILSWDEFRRTCRLLLSRLDFSRYSGIYGIPKNGLYVAVELSRLSGVPIVWECQQDSLIVDDLIDSGRTLAAFEPYDKAVLFEKYEENRPTRTVAACLTGDRWIHFPWEKPKDAEDLIVRKLQFIGENPQRPELLQTPIRVLNSWKKLYLGYRCSPEDLLLKERTPFFDGILEKEKVFLQDCSGKNQTNEDQKESCTEYLSVSSPEYRIQTEYFEIFSLHSEDLLPFWGTISVQGVLTEYYVSENVLKDAVRLTAKRLHSEQSFLQTVADLMKNVLKMKSIQVKGKFTRFSLDDQAFFPVKIWKEERF